MVEWVVGKIPLEGIEEWCVFGEEFGRTAAEVVQRTCTARRRRYRDFVGEGGTTADFTGDPALLWLFALARWVHHGRQSLA
jgi:hypothetical protein